MNNYCIMALFIKTRIVEKIFLENFSHKIIQKSEWPIFSKIWFWFFESLIIFQKIKITIIVIISHKNNFQQKAFSLPLHLVLIAISIHFSLVKTGNMMTGSFTTEKSLVYISQNWFDQGFLPDIRLLYTGLTDMYRVCFDSDFWGGSIGIFRT